MTWRSCCRANSTAFLRSLPFFKCITSKMYVPTVSTSPTDTMSSSGSPGEFEYWEAETETYLRHHSTWEQVLLPCYQQLPKVFPSVETWIAWWGINEDDYEPNKYTDYSTGASPFPAVPFISLIYLALWRCFMIHELRCWLRRPRQIMILIAVTLIDGIGRESVDGHRRADVYPELYFKCFRWLTSALTLLRR